MLVARGTMLVVGVLGVGVALYIPRFGGAFEFALNYYSIFGPGFMMPVALGMIFRRTPWWSGIAACVAAFTSTFLLIYFDIAAGHALARNVFSAVLASSAVFALSALWYRADDPRSAEAQRLDRDLRTPTLPVSGAVSLDGLRVYGVIGSISLVLGAVLMLCTALPGSATAPAVRNLLAGLLLTLIGLALRRVAARADRPARATPPA
jgi:hypothetical protein